VASELGTGEVTLGEYNKSQSPIFWYYIHSTYEHNVYHAIYVCYIGLLCSKLL